MKFFINFSAIILKEKRSLVLYANGSCINKQGKINGLLD